MIQSWSRSWLYLPESGHSSDEEERIDMTQVLSDDWNGIGASSDYLCDAHGISPRLERLERFRRRYSAEAKNFRAVIAKSLRRIVSSETWPNGKL
jgi:hypothetical protein